MRQTVDSPKVCDTCGVTKPWMLITQRIPVPNFVGDTCWHCIAIGAKK